MEFCFKVKSVEEYGEIPLRKKNTESINATVLITVTKGVKKLKSGAIF